MPLSILKRLWPARGFGITLMIVFLLVPLLFVFYFVRTDPAGEPESPDRQPAGGQSFQLQSPGEQPTDVQHSAIQLPVLPQDTADLPEDPPEAPPEEPATEQQFTDEPEEEPEEEPEISHTGVAYLTFDDGPSRAVTPGILDLLEEEGIPATFFVLPRNDTDDLFMRIIDEGHEIGNHSFSHDYTALYKKDVATFRNDVIRARNYIYDNFGYTTKSFRFPGGSMTWTREVLRPRIDVLRDLGYKHFDWQIDSGDAYALQRDKSAEALTENVLGHTRGREHIIILMHDNNSRATSLEALPMIIEGLREQGYTFDILRNYP